MVLLREALVRGYADRAELLANPALSLLAGEPAVRALFEGSRSPAPSAR